MEKEHHFSLTVNWTGNKGHGTRDYRSYSRDHIIIAEGKPDISGSSDPVFRGDKTKYNPEELLVASLSACHLLSYLHVCVDAGVIVIDYSDKASGTMVETPGGGGHFSEVTLHPVVTVSEESMIEKANSLHEKAASLCFIASSCNFPVRHEPVCKVAQGVSSEQ